MAKRKQKRDRLQTQAFSRVVTIARAELADGRPTFFAKEGSTIAGLRAGLLLGGAVRAWRTADTIAREATGEALRDLGAKRPSWLEGQRGYTDTVTFMCMRCARPLRDDPDSLSRRYCSMECRRWAHDAQRRRARDEEEGWEREAEVAALEIGRS